MRRLSFEASHVQTNTRDQESRASSNRTIPLYGDLSEKTKRARIGFPKQKDCSVYLDKIRVFSMGLILVFARSTQVHQPCKTFNAL